MFLTRRNVLALGLLILAALCWNLGRTFLADQAEQTAYTAVTTPFTKVSEPAPSQAFTEPVLSQAVTEPATAAPVGRGPAYALCAAAAAAALVGVILLRQREPALGPDGALLLLSCCQWLRASLAQRDYLLFWPYSVLLPLAVRTIPTLALLICLRELWGWLLASRPLGWCAVSRLAGRCRKPQQLLLVPVFWILGAMLPALADPVGRTTRAIALGSAVFALLFLWNYGKDLAHLQRLLENFRIDQTVAAGDGAFAKAEETLARIQESHREALSRAVAGERFKVELISNVSHDLRTPLTAIVGYSELLERETLSPEGAEQLRRLRQKAGYMSELVESLFELTKVSSGVVPAKRESLDLIRLLEQTLGLFDDQLTQAGLCVRRRYEARQLQVVTDGARMHQVFANLLENAIKYALAGTRIYLETASEGDWCQVCVINTASYEMDFQPEHIVEQFVRGSESRSTKGSGLGLAIARTYTQSVGGSFHVRIHGDQFTAVVRLPLTERDL